MIWLRGIAKLQPSVVGILGLLSPVSATFLGWIFLKEVLNVWQAFGLFTVLLSVFVGQYAYRPKPTKGG